MSWSVSEEAITAIDTAATQLEESREQMKAAVTTLKNVFDENSSGLGAHADQIQKLIEDVEAAEEAGWQPVKKLTRKLVRARTIRQEHIDGGYTGKSR